jgi:hypothetical protein
VVKPLLLIIYAANQHTNYLLFTLTQRSAELTSDPYFIAEWRRCEWILTFTQPIEQMTSVGMRKKIKQIAGTFVTLVIVVLSPDGFSGTAHAEDSDSDRFNYASWSSTETGSISAQMRMPTSTSFHSLSPSEI